MMETGFKRALQRNLLSAVTVNTILTAATTYAVKCLKDATVPDTYAINVYYCEDASKPVCCKSSSTASLADSCCEQDTWVSMRNQIILWSVLFGLVATVVTVWLCYRKDNYICEREIL